jgi:hypothetical protein
VFTANGGDYEAGAIWNSGGTLTINNSKFSGNDGYYGGEAILSEGDALTVTNSSFYGNGAGPGTGGAILADNAVIKHCDFRYNGAGVGGAIGAGTLYMENSIVTENHSQD